MFKKLFFIGIWVMCFAMQAQAVLKEKDINSSLAVLRHELTTYHREQQDRLHGAKIQSEQALNRLKEIMLRSAQNSLMLYSQKTDYVFDLTYACNEATEQYKEFQKQIAPFKEYVNRSSSDIARYDSLIDVLSKMPVRQLSPQAKCDRDVCLALAVNIRRMLIDNNEALKENMVWYNFTERQLKNLNDYANKRYQEIQVNIFRNGGTNYFKMLSEMNWRWLEARAAIAEKYTPTNMVKSQWDVKWIIGLFIALVVYTIISLAINFIGIRYLLTYLMKFKMFKGIQEGFLKKRTCIMLATSVVTLAIILGILRITLEQNFVMMASNLLISYTWLLAVILISMLFRIDSTQIKNAYRIYSPLLLIGLIVIIFRIVLIPNEIVNVLFPPLLLICTLWQWSMIKRHKQQIPRFDRHLAYVSLTVFIISLVCSWLGYTLFSVQLLIWWIMQMTCMLTLECVRDWLNEYRKRKKISERPITGKWRFLFVYHVVMPILMVFSVLLSVYWAADVFNLGSLTWDVFKTPFIDTPHLKMSLFSISQVIVLFIIFNYLNHTFRALVKQYYRKIDPTTAESRSVMIINVLQVVIWGIWLLLALAILNVSNTWLVVISGGLSTGVGFAMKDILENIYYGISLMAGRIKVGDWIECDGTKGKVSSISYTSTQIEAIDGSVIALTNSQLFTKNYKNLTKNHGYVLCMIPFGVAYGTNMKKVITLIEDTVNDLNHPAFEKDKKVKVVFTEFGDSSINFKLLCWVDAIKQIYAVSDVMGIIYDTLNKHNIEIPFPQRDIHVITQSEGNDTPKQPKTD